MVVTDEAPVDQTELIAALNRLEELKEQLQQNMSKMEKLLKSWETLAGKLEDFLKWLDTLEDTLKNPLNLKTPSIVALEKQMEDLQVGEMQSYCLFISS